MMTKNILGIWYKKIVKDNKDIVAKGITIDLKEFNIEVIWVKVFTHAHLKKNSFDSSKRKTYIVLS